jgi:excisionase family DNA binding protein
MAQISSTLPEWSTTTEFAEWLGVDRTVIYYLAARGGGPPRYRIGKEHRYRRADIERWLEARRVDSGQPSRT